MGKLFASLYLYIIVSLFLVSGVIEQLWPYEDSQQQLSLDDEFGQSLWLLAQTEQGVAHISANFGSNIVPKQDLVLPEVQQQTLQNKQYIYLFDQQQRAIWYVALDSERLLQIGPIDVSAPAFSSVWPYLLLLCVVGIPVGLWSFLLWRDFSKLRQACEAVDGSQDFELSESSKSFFLPITDTLSAMQLRIQHLLNAHQELTSSVSHEFRTPLARLKFALAMLEERITDEKSFDYIDTMQLDIIELESLVKEMLDYARLDSQQPNMTMQQCDLVQLVHSVITKLDFATEVQLVTNLPQHYVYLCDSHFIARCIQNLIGNALKYAQHQVKISLVEEPQSILLIVEDDGQGIEKSQWEEVFKPFARLDKSRDKKTGGFGLGLAIVAKIVSWHQGNCEVSNSSFGGAKLTVRLNKQQ
ncbi:MULTISPECIES: ATP-binding protein [unclassified Pseudoalteromonas]|uniref:ATP-binding protein n=1 Tax=unclassified Pseudoalteromonas TaxID=194690 RepID=UPI000B3D2F15|nr:MULTISPECIES: ATP-binding protein [unclassified Pseudoalteromonas]MDN3378132.1 ATP-binding protein [Pseudoalteromonas sp. APC 3893]MDN3386897.1 ATP-binding protein [Pseudoalteromonas sp. APC 4017]OUS74603.1 two-component sensor histidine kinase [Pseudoalteromonas sp. A601]